MRPERVARLPESMPGGCLVQGKLDGWRCVAFIDDHEVVLQARSGRMVTDRFPEVLPALATRAPGTVFDGELVAVRDRAFDFQALAGTPRSRAVFGVAVSYIAFDVLCDGGDEAIMPWPLSRRWPRLLELLDGAPPQLQAVMATTDRTQAQSWLQLLAPIGVEGLVGKSLASPYRAGTGHGWVKVRSSDTVDAGLVGVTGGAARPTALRVKLADGGVVTTVNLDVARAR